MDTQVELPLLFYPSRLKMGAFLAFCILFVAIGIWMVVDGDRHGYFVAGGFALGLPIFGISLSRRASYLRLDEQGLTYMTMYRGRSIPWKAIQEVGIIGTGFRRMVGFNFVPGFGKDTRMRHVSRAIGSLEGVLPDTYGLNADELADLLASFVALFGPPPALETGESFQPAFDRAETLPPR